MASYRILILYDFIKYDASTDHESRIDAIEDLIPAIYQPNDRFTSLNNFKSIDTWNTRADVDEFCSTYNCENRYGNGADDMLELGNIITINDGTYNVDWVIAGFDCEKNTIDSKIKQGIYLIPKTTLGITAARHNSETMPEGYYGSSIRQTTLPAVANNLKTVLGDHLIIRDVELSCSIDPDHGTSSSYTHTFAECTLLSLGQITPYYLGRMNNKYDDGEANYTLPLYLKLNELGLIYPYDKDSSGNRIVYWTRNISFEDMAYQAYLTSEDYYDDIMTEYCYVRPLILIR